MVLDKTRALLWGGELVVTSAAAAAHSLPSCDCKKQKQRLVQLPSQRTDSTNIQRKQDLTPRKLAKEPFISRLPRHIRPSD